MEKNSLSGFTRPATQDSFVARPKMAPPSSLNLSQNTEHTIIRRYKLLTQTNEKHTKQPGRTLLYAFNQIRRHNRIQLKYESQLQKHKFLF